MKARAAFETGSPEYYGFGVGIMKQIKVCQHCGASESAGQYVCGECGARLPAQTLFQQYQRMHRQCAVCDTVLAADMKFCPHCGVKLDEAEKGDGDEKEISCISGGGIDSDFVDF